MATGPASFYDERVLPRCVDVMCANQGMVRWRRRAIEGLTGTVVEVGFGSGANVELLPDHVTRVYAVEPSSLARRRAAPHIDAAVTRRGKDHRLMVEHVGLDGQSLPLPDASCDGALATFTLCTIPDPSAALRELHRVLRPGGRFHFLEHGASPDDKVRRWQHRFEPWQRRLGGGCHLTRVPTELVERAGFRLELVEQQYARGPKPWTWFTLGQAVRLDDAPAPDAPAPGAPAPDTPDPDAPTPDQETTA